MTMINCATARERWQSAYDRGREPDPDVQAHVAACPGCGRFREFTVALGGRLKKNIDDRAQLPIPTEGILSETVDVRRKRRRLVYSVSGLAAALIIGLGGLIGTEAARTTRIRQQVSEETQYFIDDLLNRPLMEGIEFAGLGE